MSGAKDRSKDGSRQNGKEKEMVESLFNMYSVSLLDMKYFTNKDDRVPFTRYRSCQDSTSIYEFEAQNLELQKSPMAQFKNQICLIVNVATF
ncbi:unnamed protein product [Didymodactylos carnosus]|uniref:Uncharacterized protein n=1 Tax=Didymodactylos carnosus TaxID=1234261 RepID=A0A813XPN7_9BILA|nr:unnamed protein product [Didymodactylos carnosus]CAF0876336.1 unnamed protein product [Didymodactylos carnosus]CAF3513051.1 unnamed protein product [Didymodactylos carnosus]CAF3663163.1 unnamed protein product [Didymodactylos carnosus]